MFINSLFKSYAQFLCMEPKQRSPPLHGLLPQQGMIVCLKGVRIVVNPRKSQPCKDALFSKDYRIFWMEVLHFKWLRRGSLPLQGLNLVSCDPFKEILQQVFAVCREGQWPTVRGTSQSANQEPHNKETRPGQQVPIRKTTNERSEMKNQSPVQVKSKVQCETRSTVSQT